MWCEEDGMIGCFSLKASLFSRGSLMEGLFIYVKLRVVQGWRIAENLNQTSVDKYLVLTNL